MRWETPYNGEQRVVKCFAILPITIDHEVRWLEKVTILQRYSYERGWVNDAFADEQEGK